jgi:hypothetical protein
MGRVLHRGRTLSICLTRRHDMENHMSSHVMSCPVMSCHVMIELVLYDSPKQNRDRQDVHM